MNTPRASLLALLALASTAAAQTGGPYNLTWSTVDGGGGTSTGGSFALSGTVGQPDAGFHTGGNWTLAGGFWPREATGVCYANCDLSTTAPVLNVLDFTCFLNKFASGDPYANCDSSTTPPVLNVQDFACYLNMFAAGCS
jgi:hypothetical protein